VASAAPTRVHRVTADCTAYTYASPGPRTVMVSAPTSSGSNNREPFWDTGGPHGPDLTVCARFVDGSGVDRQGVVLRMDRVAGGGVAAITVTRNVWAGAFDEFNSHVGNTRTDPPNPISQFGSPVVPEPPVGPAVCPLHLCARTVADNHTVEFVAWTDGQSRPASGSARGRAAIIPAVARRPARGVVRRAPAARHAHGLRRAVRGRGGADGTAVIRTVPPPRLGDPYRRGEPEEAARRCSTAARWSTSSGVL